MNKPFYITTTLPYVNGEPHVGFAMEIIMADVLARYHRLVGDPVFFNTGTDEHGLKIYRRALEEGKTPQDYVDEMAEHFRGLKGLLNLSYDRFLRTTEPEHVAAAQEFWQRCEKAGDIYKKNYQAKYCVGCELEKTDSDLVEGRCPEHPKLEIEIRDEENYFFRWSKYQDALLKLYAERPDFVIPKKRLNEIRAFVERGIQDFSISRLKEKMPWGVPVPGDEEHVMYVWFDALVNYISTLGWPEEEKEGSFQTFWPGVQIAGKDNVRQQAGMWQGMLLSAGIVPSRQILINGFISVDGEKMSKSLGNVIAPKELVERFGTDGARYLLLSLGNLGEDSDITWEWLTEKYNADLANGLGNLVSRVLKLAENLAEKETKLPAGKYTEGQTMLFEKAALHEVLLSLWAQVSAANVYIDQNKPWELVRNDTKKFEEVMKNLLERLSHIAFELQPFLPETAEKIQRALESGKVEPLFQRIK